MKIISMMENTNFKRYWISTSITNFTSNILQFVISLYVLDITGSALIFASVLSISIFPRLIFSPISGVIGDNINKIKAIHLLWFCTAIFLFCVTIISCFFSLSLVIIIITIIILEIGEIFESSITAGIIPLIVKKEDIASAISLSQLDNGITGLLAPFLSSYIYGMFSIKGIFIFSFFLYSFSSLYVRNIFIKQDIIDYNKSFDFLKSIKGTMKEVFKSHLNIIIVILPFFINFFLTSAFNITLTYIIREELRISNYGYSLFSAVLLLMNIIVPLVGSNCFKNEKIKTHTIISLFSMVFSFFNIFIIYTSTMEKNWIFLGIMIFSIIISGAAVIFNIYNATLFNLVIPQNKMSSIASIRNMFAMIGVPLGQIVYGFLIEKWNSQCTILLSCIGLLFCSILFYSIYKKSNVELQFKEGI